MRGWSLRLAVAIFLTGPTGYFSVLRQPSTDSVEMIRDGEAFYLLDFSVQKDQVIHVEYGGHVNMIQIQSGRIRILEADCPDHTRVPMGWLDSAAPIVCLPNHLVI